MLFPLCLLFLLISCGEEQLSSENEIKSPPLAPEIIRADSLIDAGDLATGTALYEGKIAQHLAEKNYAQYLHLQTLLIKHLREHRQFEEAMALVDQAIPLGEAELVYDQDTLMAEAYYEKGALHYYNHEYPGAIKYISKALEIRKRTFPNGHPDINQAHYAIGNCNLYSRQNEAAISSYKQLINSQNEVSDRLKSLALKNISLAYRYIGEIDLAEKYLGILLAQYDENDSSKIRELVDIYYNLCDFAYSRRNYRQVIIHANKGVSFYQNEEIMYPKDSLQIASLITYIALAYKGLDSLQISKAYHLKSLELIKKNEIASALDLASRYNNLAIVCQKLKQSDLALDYQHKALVLYKEKNFFAKIAGSYHNIGWILEESNQFKRSLEYHHQALLTAIPSFTNDDIYELPLAADIDLQNLKVIMYIAYKAKAFFRKYLQQKHKRDLHTAHQHYQLCLQLVQRSQKLLLFDASKINLISNSLDYFEDAIYTCIQLGKVENDPKYEQEAFIFSEMSKSVALLESILKLKNKQNTTVDEQTTQQVAQLGRAITEAEKEIYNEQQKAVPSNAKIKHLQNDLLGLYFNYDSLLQNITKADLRHSKIHGKKSLNIHKLQANLNEDQTLVSFFLGKKHSYAFALNQDTLHTHHFTNDSLFQKEILRFNQVLRNADNIKLNQDFSKIGHELYQKTLAPLSPFLRKRLIIIPDGTLRLIPFETLLYEPVVSAGGDTHFKDLPFLINKHAISYHYSSNLFAELKSKKSTKSNTSSNRILAFAPEFQAKNERSTSTDLALLRDMALQPLYFNKQEIKAIKKIYPTKSFIGRSATKMNFKRLVKDYQVIHLASHAVVNNDEPNYSFIAFNQHHDTLDLDNILYINEIYQLPLQAKLVVLSACQTAEGKLHAGEGMISLARAFMYAGANSLLTTLWEINDAQSVYFMDSFYTYLKEGDFQDIALQKAKLAFIDNYNPHPYYWATFIQIGNPESF